MCKAMFMVGLRHAGILGRIALASPRVTFDLLRECSNQIFDRCCMFRLAIRFGSDVGSTEADLKFTMMGCPGF